MFATHFGLALVSNGFLPLADPSQNFITKRELRAHAFSGTMAQRSVKKVMTQPINLIFRFLQSRTRIQVWLYERDSVVCKKTVS